MHDAEYGELLTADVALRRRIADVDTIAAALTLALKEPEVTVASEIARVTGGDAQGVLDAEVHALVERAGGSARRALESRGGLDPRLAVALPTPEALASPAPEQRYVDFLPLGEGGMGIVYWAHDQVMDRKVAFKVVRPPGSGGGEGVTPPVPFDVTVPTDATVRRKTFDDLSARFLREARITGGMEHPGIAPVYELGSTREGVPYYTMRLISGNRTLSDAIREVATQDVEARLDLLEPFLKVCDTVRYAHDRGVVHRDLKPANVALGEYGEVVVLDWGLAALLDRPDPDAPDVAVGTPGYMSPEAAAARIEDVGRASDVFSLGAILVEILGATDPGVPEALVGLARRMLARAPEDRPEDVGEVAATIRRWQAQRAVDREVEVLLREAATELDAAENEAGDALLRRLDHATAALSRAETLRPGRARKDIERVKRLRERGIRERERAARRHLLQRVVAVAVTVTAVVGVIVASLLEARRREAVDARTDATAAREHAEEVMGFMVGDLQEKLEPLGQLEVLTEIGDRSRHYYEKQPLDRASVESLPNRTRHWVNLGDVHAARGDLSQALESYERAEHVAARLAALRPEDPDARFLVALTATRVGRALLDQGHRKQAHTRFEEHGETFEALHAGHPDEASYRDAFISSRLDLALSVLAEGHTGDALAMLDQTQKLAEQTKDADRSGAWWQRHLEIDLHAARILGLMTKLDEGMERADEALAHARHLRAHDGDDVRWIRAEVQAQVTRGVLASRMGGAMAEEDWRRALEPIEAAHVDARRLRETDPLNMTWAALLATTQRRRGFILQHLDDAETALACHLEAASILESLTDRDPSNASWRHQLATQCDHIVWLSEDPDEQLRLRRLALEQARWLRARDPEDEGVLHLYAYALGRLGRSLSDRAPEESVALYRESFLLGEDLTRRAPGVFTLTVMQTWNAIELSGILRGEANRPERLRLHRRTAAALDRTREIVPTEAQLLWSAARVEAGLAHMLSTGTKEEVDEARQWYEQARRTVAAFGATPAYTPGSIKASKERLDRVRETLLEAGHVFPEGGDD